MIKQFFMTVLLAIAFEEICAAQTNIFQSVTNWGESVNGVQLSISLSNNILSAGSSSSVQCRIRNLSTNTIGWWVVEPTQGFNVFLTDSSGKIYRLTPLPITNSVTAHITYSFACKVEEGGTYGYQTPINIGKSIKFGNYQLKANQYFYQLEPKDYFHIVGKRQARELISNSLEVQVK
jgi:hypothetical protein